MKFYLNVTEKLHANSLDGMDEELAKGFKEYTVDATDYQQMTRGETIIDWEKTTAKTVKFKAVGLTQAKIDSMIEQRKFERRSWVESLMEIVFSAEKIGDIDTDTRVELLLLERHFERTGDFPENYEQHFQKAAIFVGGLIQGGDIVNIPPILTETDIRNDKQ